MSCCSFAEAALFGQALASFKSLVLEVIMQSINQSPSLRYILGAALLVSSVPTLAQSFSDSTMSLGDYLSATYRQTGSVTINNTSVAGNPGDALSVSFATPTTPPFTFDTSSNTFLAKSFTFDPALSAPGYSISFSLDKSLSYTPSTYPGSNGQGFLISQAGQLFLHVVSLANVQGLFQTASFAAASATDFSLFNPATGAVNASAHPNFGAGAMQFGFTSSLTISPNSPSIAARAIYDNFGVSITSAVPEPSGYALMLAGLLLMATVSFHRSRRGEAAAG